jgi:hypothetical protein
VALHSIDTEIYGQRDNPMRAGNVEDYKETRMKRAIIVVITFLLALPAIGFAGSATSRWDLTIGGYVKFDMGYATQGQGQDIYQASRSGNGAYENMTDKYGNFYMYSGETRLNFLTIGPDAWGARTSAFIEADFRGNQSVGTSTNSAGTFGLRHAFMQLEWPNSKLVIGQTWQTWGFLPTWSSNILDNNDLSPFLKGMRQPLVRFEQTFAKAWTYKVGIISPTNTLGSNTSSSTGYGAVDSYTRSQMPFFEGSFGWMSDKCGKIGPWMMLFSLDGFYGRQKQLSATGLTATNTAYSVSWRDKDVDAWGISFKGFIPIIPDKKGNKAGALSASGVIFYTQNPGFFQSSSTSGSGGSANYSYNNIYYTGGPNNTVLSLTAAQQAAISYSAPVQYGGWGQISYFITDKLYLNGWYGYVRSQVSDAWRLVNSTGTISGASSNGDAMVNNTQIIANILYDANSAVRMGFEYGWYNTRYANYAYSGSTIVGAKDGTAQSFRVGAWYFF